MIKDGVIVDTSVLIDFLKKSDPNSQAVEVLINERRIITTGIITAELLQGIRSANEEALVISLIDCIPTIEIDSNIWLKAGRLSCELRRKGITLPLTDIAIASVAIEHNLSIFTLDKHFEQIPEVKIYKI